MPVEQGTGNIVVSPGAGPIDYDPDAWMYEQGGPYYNPPAGVDPWANSGKDLGVSAPTEPDYYRSGGATGGGIDYTSYKVGDVINGHVLMPGFTPADIDFLLGLKPGETYTPSGYTTPTGGGTGEGWSEPSNAWTENYSLENAPSWWRGMTPGTQNEETEYISLMNAMIPFLSPEDQRTVASNLYQMLPEYFGSYNPDTWMQTTPAEYELDEYGQPKLDEEGKPIVKTPEQVNLNPWARAEQTVPTLLAQEYSSTRSAQQQMAALESMAKAQGLDASNLGPGFRYLQQVASALKSFGANANPEEGWTRAQKQKYMSVIDPLLAAAGGTSSPLSAYAPLVKMMTQPYFSNIQQPVLPYTNPATGAMEWGGTNPQWYG